MATKIKQSKIKAVNKTFSNDVVLNDVLPEDDNSAKADLVNGKVPESQLPSYVDDVLEYADSSAFPAQSEQGKIYVALDTNLTYRWSGSAYVQIGPSGVELYDHKVNISVKRSDNKTTSLFFSIVTSNNTAFNFETLKTFIKIHYLEITVNVSYLYNNKLYNINKISVSQLDDTWHISQSIYDAANNVLDYSALTDVTNVFDANIRKILG